MADKVAIQDEIAVIEKKIEELQGQLKDAKARLHQASIPKQDAAAQLSKEDQLALIKVNLKEVLNPEIMDAVLNKGDVLKIYWGTATTGRPHCGYVRRVPLHSHANSDHCIVRPRPQDCPVLARRLPRQDPARRYPRVP